MADVGAERTTLIGREGDVPAIERLLQAEERLITLVGAAGVGKTRLALHVAARRRDVGAPVLRVELQRAASAEDAAVRVAAAASVALSWHAAMPTVDQVGRALAEWGPLLLVIDDFDHLVPHAEETVGRWLELAPRLRCLVTSRQALGVAGELRYEVQPLAADDALALFVDRVRASSPGFELTDASAPVAREIVARLDHLPLAIELAAARAVVLAPQEILGRLDRRLELLRVGSAERIGARHGTLREALEWSWSLLGEPERGALAALSVFDGGFSVAGAVAVLGGDEANALDLLTALRERSLVTAAREAAEGEARFDLLESVRELAAEKLDERGERAAVEARHAAHFLEAGERWAAAARGAAGADALRRLRLDAGNLAAAGQFSLTHEPATSVRVVLALGQALSVGGPDAVQLALLDRIVAAAAGLDGALAARALLLRGDVLTARGRHREGADDLEAAARLAREAGERAIEADAQRMLGVLRRDSGAFEAARPHLERAAELFHKLGDIASLGRTVGNLGTLYRQQGRLEAARGCYQRALEHHRTVGDRGAEGLVLAGLGHLARAAGNPAEARTHYEEALPLLRGVGDRRTEGVVLDRLGLVELEAGDAAAALGHLDSARDRLAAVGDFRLEAITVAHRAVALAALGREEDALAAVDAARRAVTPVDDVRLTQAVRALRGCVDSVLGRRAALAGDAATADDLRTTVQRMADDVASVERRLASTLRDAVYVEYLTDARQLLERVLGGALDAASAAAPAPEGGSFVEVGPESRWIRLATGDVVSVPPLLARLLDALVEHRVAHPGESLAPEALAALVWPEDPDPAGAAGRLYTAVAKLRRRGLESIVVRQGGGYLVHSAVRCVRSDKPKPR
ncbi:MAG TPA: tetratricopeptide repeat protein [Kofleriaceae bacterium]|nr:tetratricopeptide repeat protein [Kofleriaceae bacterium]